MAIIVEDGTLVTDANSFVSRAEYIAYALDRGVVIADDTAADVQLIKATEFIASHEANLKGTLVDRTQTTPYPRYNLQLEGFELASTEIPRQVILCQLAVALDINDNIDPYNTPANPNLIAKSKRVEGAVTVSYAVNDGNGQKLSRSSRYEALLASLLNRSGLLSIPLVRT